MRTTSGGGEVGGLEGLWVGLEGLLVEGFFGSGSLVDMLALVDGVVGRSGV